MGRVYLQREMACSKTTTFPLLAPSPFLNAVIAPAITFTIVMYLSLVTTEKTYPTTDQTRTGHFQKALPSRISEGAVAYYKARFLLLPQISASTKDRGPEQKCGVTFRVNATHRLVQL